MPEIPLGQLLLLIAFILFPLINWLLQRMQRRFEGQAPRQPPAQPVPRTFANPPPVEVVASARERMPRPDVPKTAPSRRSQSIKTSLFRSRRDLRRAIILMAILGPCRAVDSERSETGRF